MNSLFILLLIYISSVYTKSIHENLGKKSLFKDYISKNITPKINRRNDSDPDEKHCLPSCKDIQGFNKYTLNYQELCNHISIYCMNDDHFIYGLNNKKHCKTVFFNVLLFEIKILTESKLINLYNDKVENPSNLCIYQCTSDKCKKTFGHVKVDNVKKSTSSYYYINSSYDSGIEEATEIESSAECSEHIGELVKIRSRNLNLTEICFNSNYSIPFDYYYGYDMMSGIAGPKSPFSTDKENVNRFVITL